jgi:hypothetical protein
MTHATMPAGCGRPDAVISVLQNHHDLWARLNDHAVNGVASFGDALIYRTQCGAAVGARITDGASEPV